VDEGADAASPAASSPSSQPQSRSGCGAVEKEKRAKWDPSRSAHEAGKAAGIGKAAGMSRAAAKEAEVARKRQCDGGASHRARNWKEARPAIDEALRQLGRLYWVGVQELFAESLCAFAFRLRVKPQRESCTWRVAGFDVGALRAQTLSPLPLVVFSLVAGCRSSHLVAARPPRSSAFIG
jgi:hypothetical protein